MNVHALELLEFPRVVADVALRAECDGARAAVAEAHPIADAATRARECALLAEAIRRTGEPGNWLAVGTGELLGWLDDATRSLGVEGLLEIASWLEAGTRTRAAWNEAGSEERHPGLFVIASGLPALEGLAATLRTSLDPDGRVSDAASPALRRARAELANGERDVQNRLERWSKGFGESAYVTRHGDRFVALIPGAGFPRSRGIVHDVSRSGQSLFVEPIELCDANNHLLEQRAIVSEEEQRIVRELVAAVREAEDPIRSLERDLTHLDTLRARARWAAEHRAIAIAPGGDRLRLGSARHPLLAAAGIAVVPLDLDLDRSGTLLLVSGPNMGGKTVLLKTVGLAVALAHAAFPVAAAEGSVVPEIDTIEADLGDEQSLDRGLSTFAAHLKALDEMARAAGPRTLLLADELGAGTDPEEGAPLGRVLIEHFAERGAWGVVTTHLGSLKLLAGTVPGVVNGSLEIDTAKMAPTYRFIRGVPGASHALAMAERLGFDRTLIERARGHVRSESATLERVLQDLQGLRRTMDAEMEKLAAARTEAEAAARDHREAAEASRQALDQVTRRLTRESEVLLSHARELWQNVQREARRADKTRADAASLKAQVEAVEREGEILRSSGREAYDALGVEGEGPRAALRPEDLVPGRRVRVIELGMDAEIEGVPDAEGNIRLRRGSWTIQSHVSKLEPALPPAVKPGARGGRGAAAAESKAPLATWDSGDAIPLEVDLRGREADEALRMLDQALDRAVLGGLSELRVIHGIGRGVLRAAVERHLKGHAQVSSLRMGVVGEGGRGVTVAQLR